MTRRERIAWKRKYAWVKPATWLCVGLIGTQIGIGYVSGTLNFDLSSTPDIAKAEYQVGVASNDATLGGLAIATTSATPTPAPVGSVVVTAEVPDSDKQEVMNYIIEVFGDDADRAIWVAKCESGLRKTAINDKNNNGTVDYGVFQINSVHTKKRGEAFKTDWKANVRVAKQIFDEQGFKPWVCAKNVGEKNYLSN